MNIVLDILLNERKMHKYSFDFFLILFIFLYALFALDRMKILLSPKIDGIATTNEVWIIILVYLLLNIINRKKYLLPYYKYNLYLIFFLFIYTIVIIVGGFNLDSKLQYIYAVLLFITPILLFFLTSDLHINDINILIKIMVVICLTYAIFGIILTKHYTFFMRLVGNNVDNYQYYSQYRASMMLGSSITVSYYYNLTLPLCFYLFYNSIEKKWRIISGLAIIMNVLATAILLSRNAFFCTVLIVLYTIFFMKKNRKAILKIILFILFIIVGIYALKNYDLSRLTIGINPSDSSVEARLTASRLGLYIFKKYPIFGSGMGRFFKRVYDYRYINVDGFMGLVDPHNMYVLILSETGIVGLILMILIFLILFKSFSYIREKLLRETAYITLFAFLVGSIGGSHLFNEISYSIVFWIYMGVFNAISINDRIKNDTRKG